MRFWTTVARHFADGGWLMAWPMGPYDLGWQGEERAPGLLELGLVRPRRPSD